MGTSPPGYEHADADKEKSHFLDGSTYNCLFLNNKTMLYILDLIVFFFFLHSVAASTVAGLTIGGTGLTTVLNTLFFIALFINDATTNRT